MFLPRRAVNTSLYAHPKHGPGQPLDRFPVSPPPLFCKVLGGTSNSRRIVRVLMIVASCREVPHFQCMAPAHRDGFFAVILSSNDMLSAYLIDTRATNQPHIPFNFGPQ